MPKGAEGRLAEAALTVLKAASNQGNTHPLLADAGVAAALEFSPQGEEAWIEVIQKMDAVYADLVDHQVELEHKNVALEEAQQFIDGVLSAMTDVLIVCDRNGRIERGNAALERLTGRLEGDIVGAPLMSLFAHAPPSAEDFLDKLLRGDSVADHEVALRGPEGRPVPLSVNCSERLDHKGIPVGFVLIGRPVGELRRAYESLNIAHRELRQAQQQLVVSEKMAALGRLVAGVAHELNNPISFVFGNMHALKRYGERLTTYLQAIDRGDRPEALQELRQRLKIDRVLADIEPLVEGTLEGAERVSDIVQDLRRFSSTQSEPAENFDITKIVRTAVSWVMKAARNKPDVVFDMPEVFELSGRKGPVHQIIVNLVQNAADVTASVADPRLDISLTTSPAGVTIQVHDNGPGIPADAMPRIFDPFFTTKPIGEGTGLGLYVSYGLAEELGGKLEARNHPAGGAVFSLKLPRVLKEKSDGG
ncbi:MAG: PAS domain-containing protein [Hyphomicrobiaceae bacterium]|nr:PAS domain-containing protein [Hyphomicrobiaceae bacterium]